MQPKVYVLILNWNGWKDSLECLESAFRLDYDPYQVVVCDNASKDHSMDYIRSWAKGQETVKIDKNHPMAGFSHPPVPKPVDFIEHTRVQAESGDVGRDDQVPLVLIQTGDNLGFAGGNNVGLRYILNRGDADYIWLLNNDTVVDPLCLKRMVDYSADQPDPNMCGSRTGFYDEPEVIQVLGGAAYNKWTGLARHVGLDKSIHDTIDPGQYEKQISYIVGASWLIPNSFLNDVGLMEESYFLYYEENDWCVRGSDKYRLCYADDALVYHKEGRSIGSSSDKRKTSLFSDYYAFRNQIDFTRKFYPEALPMVYTTTFLQALNRMRRGQWDKAGLILHIMMGKREKIIP